MKLSQLMVITANTDECVILEFKPGVTKRDKILSGLFNGNEEMIRVTKGRDQYYTVFKDDGSHWGWHHGDSGFTLVSSKVDELRKEINAMCRESKIALYRFWDGRWMYI